MNKEYKNWLQELKQRIRSSQIKAAVKVNTELIELYWSLGHEIVEKEKEAQWGDKLIPQLAKDLLEEFPDMKGFSKRNLFYIWQWVVFYGQSSIVQQVVAQLPQTGKEENIEIVQQPVASNTETIQQAVGQIGQQAVDQMPALFATIPWGHHLQIITKCKKLDEAVFYIQQTAEHGWSRNVLVHQLESGLYKRKGAACGPPVPSGSWR
jgi:predicted nuclease of restriction endonuclease-like (RecB) superfamily